MTDSMHNREDSSYTKSSVERELLAALLADDSVYPWDSSTLEAEAYFMAVEEELGADWQAEETSRSQHFFSQLDRLWLTATPTSAISSLQANLRALFATYIPQNWLDKIARQACQALETQTSLPKQLLQCAQELLPNYLAEDLQVLVRPYAYAMRGSSDEISQRLGSLTPEKWTNLSEIQQAKVSLAISRYALEHLQADEQV